MANIKSAMKRARQTEVRAERNRAQRTRVRSRIRAVESAVSDGKADEAAVALREAQSELARAAQSGVIHARTASRKTSRLNAKVRAL